MRTPPSCPSRDFGHDLDAMRAAIGVDTGWCSSPTRTTPPALSSTPAPLLAFLQSVPAHVTVLLDEAYTEYLSPAQRYDSIGWVRRLPNLIVARTFSKAFGLAGLRIGYGVSQPALTARMNAPPALQRHDAGAGRGGGALGDAAFLARTYALNTAGREQLAAGFRRTGPALPALVGQLPDGEVGDAQAVHARLLARASRCRCSGLRPAASGCASASACPSRTPACWSRVRADEPAATAHCSARYDDRHPPPEETTP
jgi:histidinol-phosphate aminotransferase